MYQRGRDRGWHHGHPQRDIPPPRIHHSRPYRGSYHDRREHDSYGSYHDNPCHDRNYNDSQFYSDYPCPEFCNENQNFNEHREPVYNRLGRKETYYRGGYHRERGKPARYRGNVPETSHRKYSHKPFKAHKKENESRMKTSTSQTVRKVIHNPGCTIVTLTSGTTENESETKSKSAELDTKPLVDCEKFSPKTSKLQGVKDLKVDSEVKEILELPSDQVIEMLPTSACNIKNEITESKKEDSLERERVVKEEETPTCLNPGKRAHSEERDFGVGVEQRNEESFVVKRSCSSQSRDELYSEKTVQIPLLGSWGDMPLESVVSASTSETENTGSIVNCKLPETAQKLRTAFILERKEQIEMAFAQDCKTFAFVANTLLKKDPSIEAALTSALRSSLQEMAGLCVQELNNFIDHYDTDV
ncbi:uncharacterized protein RB166_001953 isoform 1-T4 [Leptodactylus fuscus]|uniref:uncharacterized protein LOC142194893 n=1 Tax=Leptodactylus fuscus TaxID=238119 RepID=UPI003F4E52AE